MRNKEEKVKKIANKVSEKFGLVPPVDFNKLVSQNKCIIKYESLSFISDGYVRLDERPPGIYINSQVEYLQRVKFTIAHEIGHIFIPWHDDITTCSPENLFLEANMLDIQELEANIFAMELLMPKSWVSEKMNAYKGNNMKYIITEISREAQTSIMATLYAIENAFDSGNVLVIQTDFMEFPRCFIAYNTLSSRIKDANYIDICTATHDNHESFKIGAYTIDYYRLIECPTRDIVIAIYEQKQDLEETLSVLSGGKILRLLHCLDMIIEYLPCYFHVTLYKGEICHASFNKRKTALQLEYNMQLSSAVKYISERFKDFGKIELGNNLLLIWVKEPVYEIPDKVPKDYDSKEILKIMLAELYPQVIAKKKLQEINGVIGYINGANGESSLTQLYTKIRIRLECKKGLDDFIDHKNYKAFVYLRSEEIVGRRTN